ncbi:AraC family transcriptional regulator [Paucibacter sp. KBW04]|uniref:helix-turn-helix domain-containing protein n=1 Tax=Paucibacter sp. KBW04 TaxID=2153361 RepID=UPI000F5887D2|nr:AraC family transcriptional regulator [Paucibacter sp. KBW04]RQO55904.1 AraC family transcriptional regulator [Paucibacter sp. KBW04]
MLHENASAPLRFDPLARSVMSLAELHAEQDLGDVAISPFTRALLLPPRLSLGSCVRGYMVRDLRGAPALSPAQRSTWFPVSPVCTITWFLQGQCAEVLCEPGEESGQLERGLRMLPDQPFLAGPHSRPTKFRAIGPGYSFAVVLMPDAFKVLTGLDLQQCQDSVLLLHEHLGADWQAMSAAVLAAPDDASRVRVFEDFLQPRWQQCRSEGGHDMPRYRDWMEALAVRAIAAGKGRSMRQVERRIKQWSGQSLRQLQSVSRAEQSFFRVREALQRGQVVWTDLAYESGYADQAHLCRETRRVTGFSPEALRQRIETHEAFWAYRIWS